MRNESCIIALIMACVIGGCSKTSTSPEDTTTPATLTVTPTDGQSGVWLNAAIAITFAKPMDRAIVERNVHLISQRSMADSLCPDSTMMPHGGMMNVMADSSMMRHMAQVHEVRGRFSWIGDNTVCYFRPDSNMSSRTQYMIHMGREMVQMMEQRMGSMGMMGGHGTGVMSSDMMYHFTTLDTTGGGHAGHH